MNIQLFLDLILVARHTRISKINFLYAMCFFLHIDVKSTSISCKIEFHIETDFQFSVSIDVFNHLNATNIKYIIILGVNNPTTYKLFDASEKTVAHFVTSL